MTKNDPEIFNLLDKFTLVCPCEFEIVIGDNGTDEELSKKIEAEADEYIKISDKQVFKMGLPWCHNLITSIANTYKIFYIDTDEYPIWINPNIEDLFDLNYILPALRLDFLEMDEIENLYEEVLHKDYYYILDQFKDRLKPDAEDKLMPSQQDRIFNSRYVTFNGLNHSVFHAPPHFRANQAAAILLHNKTVRDAKNKERMDELMYEQYQRQNINPALASSDAVLGWGKRIKKHRFKNWIEWDETF